MRPDPIDFDSPLGISKREWVKVLGVNLALLLIAYIVALICTLCGNDLFLLRYYNEQLNAIESYLRPLDLIWIVKIPIAGIEALIFSTYCAKRKPNVFVFLTYIVVYGAICTAIFFTTKSVPAFMTTALDTAIVLGYCAIIAIKSKDGKYFLKCLARFAITLAVSFALNGAISVFRRQCYNLWQMDFSNSFYLALTLEYDLALALALGLLTLLIPWEKGEKQWTSQDASGSSPTMKKWSPKNSLTKKNNLSPKVKRRLALLKAKVIVIQTVACSR